jgi:hypothetical protein
MHVFSRYMLYTEIRTPNFFHYLKNSLIIHEENTKEMNV